MEEEVIVNLDDEAPVITKTPNIIFNDVKETSKYGDFPCSHCDRNFKYKKALSNHLKLYHTKQRETNASN